MKLLVVLTCVIVTTIATKAPIILCGRQLANARLLVCYGPQYINKRTSPETLLESLANNDIWNEDWPWDGRRGALSAGWARYKRSGLADECCLKPCTTDVILNYC